MDLSILGNKILHLEWNPEINPKYAMVDYDIAEILSLEDVFPGIGVLLCDFHREQPWNR